MSSTQRTDPPRARRGLFILLVLLVAAAVGGYAYYASLNAKRIPRGPNPWNAAVPVSVATATREPLDVRIRALGSVTPLNTVTVRSRVEGELIKVAFKEGEYVKRGQLLAEIDPRAYQVRLAQAEGQQQQNTAQLRNAENDLKRYRTLFKQDSIARQQLEAQEALVNQYRGTLKSDQAQVDDARLQLAYTRIEAPIEGRLGLRLVDVGNLVRTGDADGLVVITQTSPISVLFSVPETRLASVLGPFREGQPLTVQAWDRDERNLLATGVLKTLDNRIDATTGTLRLRAEFENADESLFPNQFVNVQLYVSTLKDAVVIPSDTVQYGSQGTYVYLVKPDNRVTVRKLVLGPVDGDRVAVTEGLEPGDRVVLEGLDRLREGREVVVVSPDAAVPSGTAPLASPGTPAP